MKHIRIPVICQLIDEYTKQRLNHRACVRRDPQNHIVEPSRPSNIAVQAIPIVRYLGEQSLPLTLAVTW